MHDDSTRRARDPFTALYGKLPPGWGGVDRASAASCTPVAQVQSAHCGTGRDR